MLAPSFIRDTISPEIFEDTDVVLTTYVMLNSYNFFIYSIITNKLDICYS